MDLSKLTPAPWIHDLPGCVGHVYPEGGMRVIAVPGYPSKAQPIDLADAEFIALARNAFDVMARRGWGVVQRSSGWFAAIPGSEPMVEFRKMRFPDPFTALVESDKWYRENVEGER
jgi:hypothetical protein